MTTRLNSIQMLPEEALPHTQWLFDAIKTERMSQLAMLDAFAKRLASVGLAAPSKSAFNRYVLAVRDGEIQRPRAIAPVLEGEVLAPAFRTRLAARLGEAAVRQTEALLFTLSQDDGDPT